MRLWLSASEIAALALPGMPATVRGVLDLAAREGWDADAKLCRARQGKGGGREYHVDCLAAGLRSTYAAQSIAAEVSPAVAQAAALEPAAPRLNAVEAAGRDARLVLIAAADAYARDARITRKTADAAYAALYMADCVPVADWVRKQVRKLSSRTLRRWREALKRGETARLAHDPGAARRGKGVLDTAENGDVRTHILALMATNPHFSADHIREKIADHFPGLATPSVRTIQIAMKRWKVEYEVALTQIANPDAYKSRHRVAGSNSHPVTRLNELWMIDASPADIMTKPMQHYRERLRCSVYVAIDIFSRRELVLATPTPRAEAVAMLIRKCITAWGVPERIKTDNGSDFVAVATQRLFAALNIEAETARAFSPEQKGHVERAVKTLQHDLMPLLPGYVGHNVTDRKVIEARKSFATRLGQKDTDLFDVDLTLPELQAYCDAWAEQRYQHRPHDGLRGRTPFAVAAAYPGAVRRIEDERALYILIAPAAGGDGLRVVTKKGVRIGGEHYLTPTVLPETRVLVRMDPADAGRALLFTPDGSEYLGVATSPELAGVDPRALVAETRARHKAMLDAATTPIKAEMRRLKPRDMVDAVLRQAAKAAGKLVELPRRAETHSTPQIEAARAALEPTPIAPVDPADIAQVERDLASERLSHTVTRLADRVEARLSGAQASTERGATPLRAGATPQQRFRLALDLRARLARGEQIDTDDAVWLGGYQQTGEHRAMQAAFDDFGDAALR